MDPIATLLDANQAINDQEYAIARDLINAYAVWRAGSGFEPEISGANLQVLKYHSGDDAAAGLANRLRRILAELAGSLRV